MSTAEIITFVSFAASTGVVVLAAYGIAKRHNRRIHIPVMLTCFAIDVANVVLIETSRLAGLTDPDPTAEGELTDGEAIRKGAVERSYDGMTDGSFDLLDFHVAVSVLSLVCYGVAWRTGYKISRGAPGRTVHRINACAFVVLRLANYITAFFV